MEKQITDSDDFELEQEQGDNPFLVHLIAGSCAGLMEHVAIFPIDTIKTHIQSSKTISSISTALINLYQTGGFLRFWSGVSVIAAGSVPAHAAYFSVYEIAKKKFGVDQAGFQFLSSAITGAIATFFHDMILTPSDMIKQRMQLSGSKKCSECIRSIIKTEGFFSFYRSLPITMMMNAPYAVTTVVVNENLKKIVRPKERKRQFLSYLFCAGMAGSVASLVTIPMDNIKTKIQTQSTISSCEKLNKECSKKCTSGVNINLKEISPSQSFYSTNPKPECNVTEPVIKYKDILSTARIIHNESGFLNGFFRGLVPRMLCNAPSCAISWGAYEFMKHSLLGYSYFSGNKQ